jgi:hypothetical protein
MFFEYLFEMKTLIITTEKYDKLIFLYLDQIFGDRIKGVGTAMEDYLYWINSDKVFLFEYIDNGFGIAESIYEKFISIFGLDHETADKYLRVWFETNLPDLPFHEIYQVED